MTKLWKNKKKSLFYYVVIVILIVFQLFRKPGETVTINKTTRKAGTTDDTNRIISISASTKHYNSSCRVSISSNYTQWYPPTSNIQENDENSRSKDPPFTDFLTFSGASDLSLSDDYNNSTKATTTTPICRIPNTIHPHFAHSMQAIYSCISWWQYYQYSSSSNSSSNSRNNPILSISSSSSKKLKSSGNQFTMSFLMYLIALYGLQIRTTDNETLPNVSPIERKGMWETSQAELAFFVQSSRHLNQVRDDIVSNIVKGGSTTAGSSNKSICSNKVFPTIGILNRKKTRSFLNSQDIANAINNKFLLVRQQQTANNTTGTGNEDNETGATTTSTTMTNLSQPSQQQVHVKYFEDATFEQQIQYFYDTDIIISPHGAQLTGLIFMSPCSQLLEVFPRRYYIPEFYGSLAYASGVNYAYIYLDLTSEPSIHDMQLIRHNFQLRESIRFKNICPSIEKILGGVKQMIQQWQICCDRDGGLP